MRMRALPSLVALALGAATAFIVACGGDGRIPAGEASSLKSALNEISTDFRAGKCDAAERAVAKAQNELLDLPNSVDAGLRDRLQSGIRNLARRVPATCDQTQSQTQETQPETTSTETTTTETDSTDTDTNTDTTGTDTDTTGTETGTTGTSTGTTSTGTTGTNTGTTGTDTGTGGTTSGGETAP
jgi:hypothetical protein